MVQSMMSYIDLSPYLWGYALQTVAYLLNKIPLKSINGMVKKQTYHT
jgi:hypothetical protein